MPSNTSKRVFIVHASEDKPIVRKLYAELVTAGYQPWLDEKSLLPGQDWDYEFQRAIETVDCVIVCLSKKATSKVGYVQREIKKVRLVADDHPDGEIFVLPVRLDHCSVPRSLLKWQYVDYFSPDGLQRLLASLATVRRK